MGVNKNNRKKVSRETYYYKLINLKYKYKIKLESNFFIYKEVLKMLSREEFTSLINSGADADTGVEALSKLKEEAAEIYDTIESLTTAKAENEKTIASLRDTNMKLFLKVGTPEQENKHDELTEEEELEKEFDSMFTEE